MEDGGFVGNGRDGNTRSELVAFQGIPEIITLAHVLTDVHWIAANDDSAGRVQNRNRINVTRNLVLSVDGVLHGWSSCSALLSILAQETAQHRVAGDDSELIDSGRVPDIHGLGNQQRIG